MKDFAEIDLKEIVLGLLKKWWLLLLSALIVGGAAYAYTANFITPQYRATVTIYVNNFSVSEENGYKSYTTEQKNAVDAFIEKNNLGEEWNKL